MRTLRRFQAADEAHFRSTATLSALRHEENRLHPLWTHVICDNAFIVKFTSLLDRGS